MRSSAPPCLISVGILAGGVRHGLSVQAILHICGRISADGFVGYAGVVKSCQISLRSVGGTGLPHLSFGMYRAQLRQQMTPQASNVDAILSIVPGTAESLFQPTVLVFPYIVPACVQPAVASRPATDLFVLFRYLLINLWSVFRSRT